MRTTVKEYIKINPEFSKYEIGYKLRSNGDIIKCRIIVDGCMKINSSYIITNPETDEIQFINYVKNEKIVPVESNNNILEINVKEINVKEIKNILKELKSLVDKLRSDDITPEWINAVHNYNNLKDKTILEYKVRNLNIPNWLKK